MKKKRDFLERIDYLIALFFLIFILAIVFSCSRTPVPKQVPEELVWPLPPEIPRIKFIASISSEEDVSGPKKKSLKELLLGENPEKIVWRLRRPHGVCADSKGRIYVADSRQGMVFVFDRKNRKVTFLGQKGLGKLAGPIGVAVDSNDNVFVSDPKRKSVYVYGPDGKFKMVIGRKGEFVNPAGIAVDKKRERLLVVDSKAHLVKVFTTQGDFITKFGERGAGEGQFNFPTHIAVGKDGFVYVSDTINFRVQVFDQDYEYYDDFGFAGDRPGQFARPKGIALDSDNNIYVVDAGFNNFQVFNQDYQVLISVGEPGIEPGQFQLPAGIYIDDRDLIYVSDSFNRRVQIFKYLKQK